MLTAEGCAARRQRLWDALPAPCDALIVAAPEHLIYFADYLPSPFLFRSCEAGAILLLEPGRATLVGDSMVGPFLDAAHVDEVVAPTWYDGQHPTAERRGLLVASTLERLKSIPGGRVGVELGAVPAGVVEGLRAARPGLHVVDLSPIIRPLRRAKDADEVAAIRRAIRAGEAGQAAALAEVRPGMTELDVYAIVQSAAIRDLGGPAILYGDFASGPKLATEKGGGPTSRVIEAGDLLLLDFSVVAGGYRGDFTNTFAVGGSPTADQRRLFDACLAALAVAESTLRPGTLGREVDAAARRRFAADGLDAAFATHTGHGVGLGHPEPPYFVPEGDESLVVGDVVAVEPGLYVDGIGGMRYEHNYLITSDGYERLSNHRLTIDQG